MDAGDFMSIGQPSALFLLLVFIPLSVIFLLLYRRGIKDLHLITRTATEISIIDIYSRKFFLKNIFFCMGIFFLIISLSDIKWEKKYESEMLTGVDVVFVVDVSNSMLANDLLPNRLERVKRVISSVVENQRGCRYALVAFKGSAVLQLPMTEDHYGIRPWLEGLSPFSITTPGTNIKEGLEKALTVFPQGKETQKIVLLFTDGGSENTKINRSTVRSYVDKKIRIISIGCGTKEGGLIQLDENRIMLDQNQLPIRVKMNADEMKKAAMLTGGEYFELSNSAIVQNIEKIFNDELKILGAIKHSVNQPVEYNLFLFFALIFFGLSLVAKIIRFKGVL